MPKRIRVLVDHVALVAELRPEGVAFEQPDGLYRITPEFDGRYRIDGPFGSVSAVAAIAGDRVWVGVEGDVVECRIGARARPRSTDDLQAALASPMPATVTKLAVAVGDSVKEGDVLVALEAMKMELPIRAPRDGVVTAIRCREGDLVEAGVPVIELGEPGATTAGKEDA